MATEQLPWMAAGSHQVPHTEGVKVARGHTAKNRLEANPGCPPSALLSSLHHSEGEPNIGAALSDLLSPAEWAVHSDKPW